MEMAVEDYLFSLRDDESEYNIIKFIFDESNAMLIFLSDRYRVLNYSLTLRADSSPSKSARHTRDTIAISRGIIDMSLSAAGIDFASTDVASHRVISLKNVGGILWIVAHEFFHYARNHASLWNSHPHLRKALEYDADCYAVAGLYRYFEHKFGLKSAPDLVPSLVFESIFWPMREMIGLVDEVVLPSSHHADFVTRLNYAVSKLALMDVPHVNYGATKRWQENFQKIMQHQIECETKFLEQNGDADRSKSILLKELIKSTRRESGSAIWSILELWEVAEPLVKKTSRLIGDFSEGRRVLLLGPGGGIALDGWFYSADQVTGFWRPQFHARLTSVDPTFYGNPSIYPNARWISEMPSFHWFARGGSLDGSRPSRYRVNVNYDDIVAQP